MRRFAVPIILAIILLACSWSLLVPGFFKIHDFVHAARVAEYARGITDGQLPVRWSANFGYGYGMPLFQFYAPLPYFFGALLYLMGLPMEFVLKMLFLVPSIICVIAAYRLSRLWLPAYGSLVVSAAITLAPYRAVNLYVRGAVSESWGMSFLLLSVLGLSLAVKSKTPGYVVLLIGLMGMVLSHNLTALMSIPLLVIWLIGLLILKRKKSRALFDVLVRLLLVGVAAVGLTAFYWLPAIIESKFTQMESLILNGYFDFHLHFLYIRQLITPYWGYGGSNWGPNDDMSFFLGIGQIAAVCLSIIIVLYSAFKRRPIRTQLLLLAMGLGSAAIAIFLSLQRSLFIWEALSVLHLLQFPWRWLSVVVIGFGFAGGIWSLAVKNKTSTVFSAALLILLGYNATYFQPEERLDSLDSLYYTDSIRIQHEMSGILPDYLPRSFVVQDPPSSRVLCDDCSSEEIFENSFKGAANIKLSGERKIGLAIADFPGWVVEVDGKTIDHFQYQGGLIGIEIPAGDHIVAWQYADSQLRLIADSISILTLISLLVIIAVLKPNWLFTNDK